MAKRVIKKSYKGDKITINDAFIEFMTEKARDRVAQDTIINYRRSFSYYSKFCNFDDTSLIEEITKDSINEWISSMAGDEEHPGKKHTTVNHYIRDIRTFAYWCMDDDREYITPTFKIKLVKGQEPMPKAFKEELIDKLLEKPRKSDVFGEWRTWAVVNWVMATGNRVATIVEIKLEDVDFKNKVIYLRHTKSKRLQSIPLSSELALRLKEYINLWLRTANHDDYLFPAVSGEQLTTSGLRSSFDRYCTKRGVNQKNLHGLRHSFAGMSLENGRGTFELQKMLGHSTLDMTKRYVDIHNMKLEKDFDKHTPLDSMKKAISRRRKIQRSN